MFLRKIGQLAKGKKADSEAKYLPTGKYICFQACRKSLNTIGTVCCKFWQTKIIIELKLIEYFIRADTCITYIGVLTQFEPGE